MATSAETDLPMAGTHASHPAHGWSAVFALTLCVSTLIASEFMPVSLLTPIATDLAVSEGQAGQGIAVSGIFAVLTSLFIASATPRLDRRHLLLALTGMMVASGLIVALAHSYALFMAGRALIGVVIGGFWSLSTATVMRLVPSSQVPRALALLNGGNALATTIAAPLGSYLGQYIGWRGAFFCVVPFALATLAWQYLTLPSMPNRERSSPTAVFRLLARPQVPLGILSVGLFFAGQFALFTYLRPFLETVTGLNVSQLSLALLGLGLAGLIGTAVIGRLLKSLLYPLLVAMPLAMAAIAATLILAGHLPLVVALLLGLWGLIGTAAPVGWWTWVARVLPDHAEAGGGLMVAVIQFAITLGASVGGLLFDGLGYRATFAASAILLVLSGLAAILAARSARQISQSRTITETLT